MWRFEIHDVLTSTLDYCRQKANQNEKSGLVVIAHEQSAGRGTRGRKWSGSQDNLALTFLLYGDKEGTLLSALPFMTGVALYDSCQNCLSDPGKGKEGEHFLFQLKWPNDLLLNGGKISGILIESGHNEEGQWLSVGVGVNLRTAPDLPDRKTASFSDVSVPPHPVIFARRLMDMMGHWLAHWQDGGNGVIYEAWLRRAHPIGTELRIVNADGAVTGTFNGLDSYGRLLLRLDEGDIIPVVTGDIFCL